MDKKKNLGIFWINFFDLKLKKKKTSEKGP